ncbi:hypothetical protein Drorol1_Dr00022989 [Drosera rotundifolia]
MERRIHNHESINFNNNSSSNRNQCLTMHQPWASLLVHGIKRVEGRSWAAPIRGRLWIHAAGKVPDFATIKAMEEFYREIYALNGVTDLKFPNEYPVSKLVGCVDVVGCVRGDELAHWQAVPEGLRLEALTDMCWLCEDPKKLSSPLEMRGFKGIYDLERKICEDAFRSLVSVQNPLQIKFPLPNPQDPFSLRPGSLPVIISDASRPEVKKSSSLVSAIAGARAAATQFSRKDPSSNATQFSRRDQISHTSQSSRRVRSSHAAQFPRKDQSSHATQFLSTTQSSHTTQYARKDQSPYSCTFHRKDVDVSIMVDKFKSTSVEETRRPTDNKETEPYSRTIPHKVRDKNRPFEQKGNDTSRLQLPQLDSDKHPRGPSKIFSAAVRGATSNLNS